MITPFRRRYEQARGLALEAQLEACIDYLQNPDVLIAEFMESYYLVERKLDPAQEDAEFEESGEELVLEPFFDSLVLQVRAGARIERIRCLAGAFAPLAGELHPALERRGLDYIGVREGSSRIVLGVSDASGEDTPFTLLLRGLNCLAELAPPFQLTRLRRLVLRDRLDPEATFDLQLGVCGLASSEVGTSLLVLTRDLAEIFKRAIGEESQFSDTVGRIECLETGSGPPTPESVLRARWRA